jgi:hypothetical protein
MSAPRLVDLKSADILISNQVDVGMRRKLNSQNDIALCVTRIPLKFQIQFNKYLSQHNTKFDDIDLITQH